MTRKSNNTRIYGLTLKQWAALSVIVITLVFFGCQFCYNLVVNKTPAPENTNSSEIANSNRSKKRAPRSTPSASLSTAQATARYLKFGNPSNAAQADAKNYLMVNSHYALSYNRLRGTANWVAWTLTEADLGTVDRANDFRPDPNLPNSFYRVTPNDYTGSGFDRGHLCPSADRTMTPEANSATFLMTNIAPQTPDLNRNAWESLESYSRELVREGNELYILAGLYGETGKVKGKIAIPSNYWKVIVVSPNILDDVSNVTADARVIAVDMPNVNGIKNDNWRKYRTTVRELERKTGLNLFSNLPLSVSSALENKTDSN